VVSLNNVSKVYQLYRRPVDRLHELLPFASGPKHTEFWALRNVTLKVEPGEVLGIVGPNGSGKSTLLQIVSGIIQPTSGRVYTKGRIAALLELGAGFNPEFTGRENVYMNGEILGLSRKQVDEAFPSIEAFAEIGEYMDRPVREYSSGMYVRLAFSTAIHVDPEILIVDEALSVGDAIFASRCIRKFEELKKKGITVLFVSHDLGLVKRLCHRAVLMLNGSIVSEGNPNDVVNQYVGLVHEYQRTKQIEPETGPASISSSFRHGDGTSRILDLRLINSKGETATSIRCGETATVRIRARFYRDCDNPVVGLLIRNRLGMDIFGTNTRIEQQELGFFRAGEELLLDFSFDCLLARNEYTLTVATQHWDGTSQDWLNDALSFAVIEPKDLAGVVHLRSHFKWEKAAVSNNEHR